VALEVGVAVVVDDGKGGGGRDCGHSAVSVARVVARAVTMAVARAVARVVVVGSSF
jgi:hypothetical protein